MQRLIAFMIAVASLSGPQVSMADRGPAYQADTPGVSEQEKQWHYQLQTRLLAGEQRKERDFRHEIASLPNGIRQRAVLIAAARLAELQLNLQSTKLQSGWADGVDPQQGTATILLQYTMSLNALASDAQMEAAAACHTFEMARLQRLALGEQLTPARPCREGAYGEALIDATTAAGDRAVPRDGYTLVDSWTRTVVAKSLAAVDVAGFFRIRAMRKATN